MRSLSKRCEYGIRASLFMASMDLGQKYVPIQQVSKELGISFHFLAKVMQTLIHHGILISRRGPNGGVALARPASDINVMDMIDAMDPETCLKSCVLGLKGCGEERPCPLHDEWAVLRERIRVMFEKTSLQELGSKINEFGFRISTRSEKVL